MSEDDMFVASCNMRTQTASSYRGSS